MTIETEQNDILEKKLTEPSVYLHRLPDGVVAGDMLRLRAPIRSTYAPHLTSDNSHPGELKGEKPVPIRIACYFGPVNDCEKDRHILHVNGGVVVAEVARGGMFVSVVQRASDSREK